MKNITKLICTSLLLTVMVVILNGMDASASAIPASAISIDYDAQKLIVKENTNQATDLQVFYAVPTIKSVNKKATDGTVVKSKVMTASSWDIYDYNKTAGVTIDLSQLNRAKDNYIQLRGDKHADPVTIKIPAVLTKVSAAYTAADAAVTLNDITNKKQPLPLIGKDIEYRTNYGTWNPYSGNDLSIYQTRGATLYFRVAAHKKEALSTTASSAISSEIVDSNGQGISAYVAGSFPGVELKVVIGKQAAAPNVTVDYGRHQFVLPKNAEYRVVTGNKINSWTFASVTEAMRLNLSDIINQIGNASAVLEVRTAATATKSTSKVKQLDITLPATLDVYTISENVKPGQIVSNNIFFNGLGTGEKDSLLIVGYVYRKAMKQFTGIQFFNTTSDTYEVYISKDGTVPTAASTGIKTIKAKAKSGKADAETYISTAYVNNGDQIYIRKKADTKNKVWSSYFIGLGTVQYTPE